MGDVINNYRTFLEQVSKFDELFELRKKCYKIFDDTCTIDEMNNIIKNDWRVFAKVLPIPINYSIGILLINYEKLSNGFINRTEFAAEFEPLCSEIDLSISRIKDKANKALADFSTTYDAFTEAGEKNADDCATKLIYYALKQPEGKEIVMQFLEL